MAYNIGHANASLASTRSANRFVFGLGGLGIHGGGAGGGGSVGGGAAASASASAADAEAEAYARAFDPSGRHARRYRECTAPSRALTVGKRYDSVEEAAAALLGRLTCQGGTPKAALAMAKLDCVRFAHLHSDFEGLYANTPEFQRLTPAQRQRHAGAVTTLDAPLVVRTFLCHVQDGRHPVLLSLLDGITLAAREAAGGTGLGVRTLGDEAPLFACTLLRDQARAYGEDFYRPEVMRADEQTARAFHTALRAANECVRVCAQRRDTRRATYDESEALKALDEALRLMCGEHAAPTNSAVKRKHQ